jgi:hypothetical protein
VANTDADADSAALVVALVSPTLLSQTNPLHLLIDEDGTPNKSPGGKMPCAIRAALHNHRTSIDLVVTLEPQTPDETVTGYFRTMMETLDQWLSNMQQQMTSANQWMASTKQWLDQQLSNIQWQTVTTIANSICDALEQKITPLRGLDALNDKNRLNATIADATTLASTIPTKMAKMIGLLRDNLMAMEACLKKFLGDIGSHINHIIKKVIPDIKNKVYNRMLGTTRGQHAAPPQPCQPCFRSRPGFCAYPHSRASQAPLQPHSQPYP